MHTRYIACILFQVVCGNLTSMNQKSFILVILSSLRSNTVSSKLLKYVVTLLAVPFVTLNVEETEKDLITRVYIYIYNYHILFIFIIITYFLFITLFYILFVYRFI